MIIIFLSLMFLMMYVLPCIGSYYLMRKMHYHPEGRWRNSKPISDDISIVFTPVANIFFTMMYMGNGWKRDELKTTDFFKPKK